MRAVVVGAGIGGLATAVALRREGLDVVVVERAPQLSEAGAGVVLGSHAMRSLDALGAADHVRAINDAPVRVIQADMTTGVPHEVADIPDAGPIRTWMTHRRDLVDALSAQLRGATVELGRVVTAVTQDERGVTAAFADGGTVRGDVLIGADGLRSTVRSSVFGESESVFTGFLAWRTVRPMSVLDEPIPERTTRLWFGAGKHVVCYPIRRGTQFYAALYVGADAVHREDWSASGDVADLRASFASACPDVRAITEGIDEAFITGIYYRDPLPTWHDGRVVLVGDAAHPVLPTSGSGAAMALEDAIALAACIRRRSEDVEGAFEEFEARRKPRTSRVLYTSLASLRQFHETDPDRIAAATAVGAGVRQLDPRGFHRSGWLQGHDEPRESAKPLAELASNTVRLPRRPEARAAHEAWRGSVTDADGTDGWISERAAYERFVAEHDPLPADAVVEAVECDGVPALRVVPPGGDGGPAVLHLHGGGYVYGSAPASAALACRIAAAAGGWALVPNYRLAPEHSGAAMRLDVRRAYAWLAERTDRVVLSGECSGAGLAIGLLAALRDEGRRLPVSAYLVSPFADMTLTNPSIDANVLTEPWWTHDRLVQLAGAYIQNERPDDPAISPALGRFDGFPPLRIVAAADESLADDARAVHLAAESAGVDSQLTLVGDSVHSFPIFRSLPESQHFLDLIAEHTARLLAATS